MLESLVKNLTERLPSGWKIQKINRRASRIAGAAPGEAMLQIQAPRGRISSLLVRTKDRLEPRDVDGIAAAVRDTPKGPVLIVAPFISERTQQRLKTNGLAYADLTGNVRLSVPEPGLFIETSGAVRNPISTPRERKSLKGARAGRLIRALCDFRPPTGLRALAKRAGIDPGYASRIIDFLDREALVTRRERGPITVTDWRGLIQRWSQQYSPLEPKRVTWYLAPRGIAQILERLKRLSTRYAVSGSWAAAQYASVSPTRLFLCYADDVSAMAGALDIRPTETGANIALITPFDPVVYERTSQKDGITIPAPSQIAADLLGSPGRGPNEAEALMEWMRDHENVWRT